MRIYYVFDPKTYVYAGQIACVNQPDNSTTISPFTSDDSGNSSINAGIKFLDGKWTLPETEPNQEQQILSTLTKQVMDLQLENVQQKQINAILTKQIMDLKGDETHE